MAKPVVTHEQADKLIERLQAIQAAPPYQCWRGGDDAYQGMSYCGDCAQKEVDAGRAEFVDGGWPQDSDGPAYCETCRTQLQYDLTEYGIEQELEEMMKYRLRAPVTPEDAYAIAQVLTNHREHSGVLALVTKVERLMDDSQAVSK